MIWREDLSDAEAKAARIADNKTAESPWDDDLLASELELLDDFDAIELGFDDGEIDDLLDNFAEDDTVSKLTETPIEDKALEDIKILNLYAGIGGNRFLWGNKVDVTAVEYNKHIAKAYGDIHTNDTVVVADAHEYLLNHFNEFDFIWTSPPCPTHSKMRKNIRYEAGINEDNNLSEIDAKYPDMSLYQEIILLEHYFNGQYCVENVIPYYEPLIQPTEFDRHYFWSNFEIKTESIDKGENIHDNDPKRVEEWLGIDLTGYDFPNDYGRQKILNNVVHPEIGKVILESALNSDL